MPVSWLTSVELFINKLLPPFTIDAVSSLIKNSDFNKLEYLQYVKIDDSLVNCLTNKTVFIFLEEKITVKLMENIVMLLHNTEGLSVQLFLQARLTWKWWNHFVKHNSKIFRNRLRFLSQHNVHD